MGSRISSRKLAPLSSKTLCIFTVIMKYPKIPVAQSIVALCEAKEIRHVVISPGSRNAPLTNGFASNPQIKAYSIVDERCAGFFALGMAQQLQKPVALVCTSGSALLNYYPAVAEAFYSDIPLIVISADRPIERIDIGDGQTIRQKNVFANHILYSANLHSEVVTDNTDPVVKRKQFESQKHNEREINLALNTAIEKKGPVHINVPFYEPLYEMVEESSVRPLQIFPEIEDPVIPRKNLQSYADIWNSAERKMIIVGVNQPDSVEQKYLDELARDDSVIVFTETTSNLSHEDFFTRIDTIIGPIEQSEDREAQFKALQPDILLTFGGMVVSKKIKAFLRAYQPKQHWHIDEKKAYNTYFCLNKHFVTSPNNFFAQFFPLTTKVDSAYRKKWIEVKDIRQELHDKYVEEIPFSDFKVFQEIFKTIPENNLVHLSNSSTIRYAQLFKMDPSYKLFCNRGTSGIDGSTSTAVGAAVIAKEPTLLLTGELGFFYDSNALWNSHIPKDFRIIVINNGGGGIFRILPGNKDSENFDQFFETVHNLNAEPLCGMYGFEYQSARTMEEVEESLGSFFSEKEKPALLEIFTPRKVNDEVLLQYFKFMRNL